MIAWVFSVGLAISAPSDSVLQAEDFAKQVVNYHPRANQANLYAAYADVEWLKAKSFTQPGLTMDYDRKTFDGKNYWNLFGTQLSIPTLYGVEFYGNFDQNTGQFLNAERNLPMNGLYAGGIKVPLGNGLWQNEIRFSRNRARLYQQNAPNQTKAELNDLLQEAMYAYWSWVEAYNIWKINLQAAEISAAQFEVVKTSALFGDRPLIDTVESHMQWQSRLLTANEASLHYQKQRAYLLTFIWDEGVKIRFESNGLVPPELGEISLVNMVADTAIEVSKWRSEHPEIRQIKVSQSILNAELKYKQNQLLPKAELKYNFLYDPNQSFQALQTIGSDYYKASIGIAFPIFMRKERAALQYTRLQQQEVEWKFLDKSRQLTQKVNAYYLDYAYGIQNAQTQTGISLSYEQLLKAEEIRFRNGESSVFLINQRENMYFQSQVKLMALEVKWRLALVNLHHARGDLYDKLNTE